MSNPEGDSLQNKRLALSEAAEAVKGALQGCHAELDKLQRRLRGNMPEDFERRSEGERQNTPHTHADYVASRLEACAGALRKAANPDTN